MILSATDIKKIYRNELSDKDLVVLDGVSLKIESGSVTSIIGSSGSGKSTLLHILGGLDRPDSGEVFWGEQNLSTFTPDQLAAFRNKHIGFVFQFHHLLPEFSALENVCMPAMIGGQKLSECMNRGHLLLDRFGIADRASHRPTQLSGGEQQRVSMARALMNKPSVILADEPTGNLDDANTSNILDLLYDLREEYGLTILLITHEKKIAGRSDTILEIKNGRLHTL